MIETLKKIRRSALTAFKMRPIYRVIKLLKQHDYLRMDHVLEVFGYTGAYHTLDYKQYAKRLEVWEIAADCESELRKNLPGAEIKITDSYAEIKKTPHHYDTIIIDNHQGIFGGDKCEHFEMIGDSFKKLKDRSVLIANVMPDILVSKYTVDAEARKEHIRKRKEFYSHASGTNIATADMEKTYRALALANGFRAEHVFFVKRNYLVTYVVLCLKKQQAT